MEIVQLGVRARPNARRDPTSAATDLPLKVVFADLLEPGGRVSVDVWKACGKEDGGVFNLDAAKFTMERPPLAQALAQVRFPLIAHLQTLAGVAPLQDRLSKYFPYMERNQVQAIAFQLGPAGAAVSEPESQTSWELTDDDGWTLVLSAGSATLSVGRAYTNSADFGSRFGAILTALAEVEQVRRCDRLGVRYLDLAATPPGDDHAWHRWFRGEVVGWPAAGILAPGTHVRSTITQTMVTCDTTGDFAGVPGDVQALIRHGFAPVGSVIPGFPQIELEQPSWLLDLDLFVASPQRFLPDTLVSQFGSLHNQIDRFFRWAMTPDGAQYFGLEDIK